MKQISPKIVNTNVWTFNQLPVSIEGKKKAVSNKGKKVRSTSKIRPKVRAKKGK